MESKAAKGVRERVEAEQDLVLNAQFLLLDVMSEKGVTQAELARRAGLSRARLSQLLRAEANPTLRTIAGLFYALGEPIDICRLERSQPAIATEGKWGIEPAPEQKSIPASSFDKGQVRHLSKLLCVKIENRVEIAQSSNDDYSDKRRSDLQVA